MAAERQIYVYRNGELVPKHLATPHNTGPRGYVISDTMDAMRHPSTGKLMDSKSRFRAETRARGCIEVGNEVMRDRRSVDMPELKADIARAITELGG